MIEAVELRPCPGCASNHTRVIGGPGTAGGPKYWAGCDYCTWRAWGDTHAEAVAAWNQRATPPNPVEHSESVVEQAIAKIGDWLPGWKPTPAMLGYARAVAIEALASRGDERAQIVAWLRELNKDIRDHNYWAHIALRIERGDHISGTVQG